MAKAHTTETIAAELTVPERVLLLCLASGTDWMNAGVADNGIGAPVGVFAQSKAGLGTSIINALAQQLEARVDVASGVHGTVVSITHATFAKMPDAISKVGSVTMMSTRAHA
jgi:signal transduction histidine kinase